MNFINTVFMLILFGPILMGLSVVNASDSYQTDLKQFLTIDPAFNPNLTQNETKKALDSSVAQFQKILDITNSDKSYIEKSSAGPESAFCKEFERDENTFKFTPSVFHTPMGKEGGPCELKDKDGKTLVKVSCDLKKNCLMQGVCILDHKDGRRIGYNFIKFNHIKKINQKSASTKQKASFIKQSVFASFDNERCPFGYGIWSKEHKKSICMDPFRSVAADTRYHKPGDVLFFPSLRGLVLPDNSVHNGMMTVRSAGGRIKGKHRFDFYTGICNVSHDKKLLCQDYGPKIFSEIGFGSYLKTKDKSCFYSYYKIEDELKDSILAQRNYPNLPESLVQNTILETWGNLISLNDSVETFISPIELSLLEDTILN